MGIARTSDSAGVDKNFAGLVCGGDDGLLAQPLALVAVMLGEDSEGRRRGAEGAEILGRDFRSACLGEELVDLARGHRPFAAITVGETEEARAPRCRQLT